MMDRGRKHREDTGEPLLVPRYEIVPIPEHLRGNLAPGSVMMFPADTAISMRIPGPMMSSDETPPAFAATSQFRGPVTPTEQSVEMFKRAGQPTDLHLVADVDHFMFSEGEPADYFHPERLTGTYFPI